MMKISREKSRGNYRKKLGKKWKNSKEVRSNILNIDEIE